VKVSELAEELGVPASAVLEQCQRFGIDAGWAGAELGGADVVVLRAELGAGDAPLDLTPADLTSVPSVPSVPDEELEPPASSGAAPEDAAGDTSPPTLGISAVATAPSTVPPTVPPTVASDAVGADAARPGRRTTERRTDRSARVALWASAIAAVALGGAELVGNRDGNAAVVVWLLWLVGAVAAIVALWSANRARRRVQTHPEGTKGLGLAAIAASVAVAATVVLGVSVVAAVGDAPAADAPLGLGERASVVDARWGYHRVRRIADDGWRRPSKDVGTCWFIDERIERDRDRVELGSERRSCQRDHVVEIVDVYAFDRDADTPFPGQEALQRDARERCGPLAAELLAPDGEEPIEGTLLAEHPTEQGWARADRDIACAVVTAPRRGPLSD
jgi:hypothetical protein